MKYRSLAVATIAIVTTLSGCGGSQPPIAAPDQTINLSHSTLYHKTFRYTGQEQSFEVPPGVTQLKVIAIGAHGGGAAGGNPGRVYAVVPVTSGETLYVNVVGPGNNALGGFNGGGSGVATTSYSSFAASYGGGGGTDIREGGSGLHHRIVVAGGGGGQGGEDTIYGVQYGAGGKGGGTTGGSGAVGFCEYCQNISPMGYRPPAGDGGKGGTQKAGGRGGRRGRGFGQRGSSGSRGDGGRGGLDGCEQSTCAPGGAGGGGGYYGAGGGGGGSSYVEPKAYNFRFWRGWKSQKALVVFTW